MVQLGASLAGSAQDRCRVEGWQNLRPVKWSAQAAKQMIPFVRDDTSKRGT